MKKFMLMLACVLGLALAIAQLRGPGVLFTLVNAGTEPLPRVTVHVTGRSYSLGAIGPGGSRSVKLNPTGESHIELGLPDARRLRIDCYFENGYRGTIRAEVTPQGAVSVRNEVRAPSLF